MTKSDKKPIKEWLLTNRLGGYSSQQANRKNSRRFHSLLVASQNLTRYNLLSSIEVSPALGVKLKSTQPCVIYALSEKQTMIEEKICFSTAGNAVEIIYMGSGKIKVRPFFALRCSHDLRKFSDDIKFSRGRGGYCVFASGISCHFGPRRNFRRIRKIKNVSYSEDKIRDGDYREEVFSPGYWDIKIKQNENFKIFFSDSSTKKTFVNLEQERTDYKNNFVKKFECDSPLCGKLLRSSLDFEAPGCLVAGFHWFESWGRDMMISIPGILLYPGRKNEARAILEAAAGMLRNGLLPNIFSTFNKPASFNSVDASLWFVWCLSEYKKIAGCDKFLKSMKKPVVSIIKNYIRGTDYNIKMDEDFLIKAGEKGKALTWMDAVYEGAPVTQRAGKPVEIQGLWYNALKFAAEMDFFDGWDLLGKISKMLLKKFYLKDKGFLADFIDENGSLNTQLRPNQIITLTLMKNAFTKKQIFGILKIIKSKLLTPYGLRTLSPDDKNHEKIYWGNLKMRDKAYHQGTVWPWLLQFYYQLERPQKKCFEKIWMKHSREAGLDCFSELFDADFPHYSRGCIHQAWTVAALLYVAFSNGWINEKIYR